MELPPYHLPTWKSVLLRAWDRLKTFVFGAGKAIIAVVVVLSVLNSLGRDGTFHHQGSQDSWLSDVGRAITPGFAPLGITRDNWPATMGIFTGIFAKEAVVGTLNALYLQVEQPNASESATDAPFDLLRGVAKAIDTIPANVAKALGALADPLGLGTLGDMDAVKEQGINDAILGAMAKRFDGRIGAFAYLLFVLLYIPCVAATGAIYRETNWRWAAFVVCWTTGVAYLVAAIFYQSATFSRHPQVSLGWIGGLLGSFALVVMVMRFAGQRRRRAGLRPDAAREILSES